MIAKLKSMGFVLLCGVLLAEGVRAENCRLSISQPRIDYGVIRQEALDESPSVVLGTRTVHLSVLCAEPSAMALRFTGAADGQGFRFGREGRFRLTLRHAQVDGRAVGWALSHVPGESASGQLLPGQVLVAQTAGKQLTAQVDIDTDLSPAALQVRNQTVLDGQGSFELVSPAVPLSR
ncbi:hypothetical protein [Pseudomonas sp. AM4(2022)]|uniref:hypothetical protein n=1 Tax=Pseudomonas sp. AM4(2022) TaxID=2983408 RepID=UPI002E80D43B|nr:hypothetical protein [Pseudomonas sp. AM4(2022)]